MSKAELYDVIIVGGGPTGLSAALYTAREKMKTLVLDKESFGGMAAITERIENYPGFKDGVGGRELIDQMEQQAEKFGAQCESFENVIDIKHHDDNHEVITEDNTYFTKAVLIASGSTYRTLGIPGEDELIGKGLHFCATCDAPLYKDKEVVVIGGGNSALQESLFIARFAKKVTILVQSEDFTGEETLIDEVTSHTNISTIFSAKTTSLHRSANNKITIHLDTIQTTDETIETDGIFVFIGLLPNSHTFKDCHKDEKNFINSDADFSTNIPGVFVAGDVRSGSTWQIGSAVGEGITAALNIRHYLDKIHPGWHRK